MVHSGKKIIVRGSTEKSRREAWDKLEAEKVVFDEFDDVEEPEGILRVPKSKPKKQLAPKEDPWVTAYKLQLEAVSRSLAGTQRFIAKIAVKKDMTMTEIVKSRADILKVLDDARSKFHGMPDPLAETPPITQAQANDQLSPASIADDIEAVEEKKKKKVSSSQPVNEFRFSKRVPPGWPKGAEAIWVVRGPEGYDGQKVTLQRKSGKVQNVRLKQQVDSEIDKFGNNFGIYTFQD